MRVRGLATAVTAALGLLGSARGAFLDGPHVPLATANSTVLDPFQWWYFDIVPSTGPLALQVVFYSGLGFGPLVPNSTFYAQITYTLPNGTSVDTFAAATAPANVTQAEEGEGGEFGFANGTWPGIGGFSGTETGYTVVFEDGEGVVSGNLTLESVAPAHYPCSLFDTPSSMVGPGLGWTNAIPGAKGTAFLTIGNETLTLSGNAYHDSNFGTQALPLFVDEWLWGRGVVGNYTFVYFSYIPKGFTNSPAVNTSDPNTWFTSGYLATDGNVVANFCSQEQVPTVRAKENLTLTLEGEVWNQPPPTISLDNSTANLGLVYNLGNESFSFNITSTQVALAGNPALPYLRWTSNITGGKDGDSPSVGKGYFEILKYGDDLNATAA